MDSNGTDQAHNDPERKGDHSAKPMAIEEREREWYRWEQTRNAARRKQRLYAVSMGCVIVIVCIVLWAGLVAIVTGALDFLGWL
jgi:hypothetical protein